VSIVAQQHYDVTFRRTTGEDASGNAQTQDTKWPCAFQAFTESESRAAEGPVSADACRILVTDRDALATFGTGWTVNSGDTATIRGRRTSVHDREVSVLDVIPAENPRTGDLHSIQVSCA
jgi:hypothetical protein